MAYSVCHAHLELCDMKQRSVTIATMELQTGVLSTLADYISVTSLRHQFEVIVVTITYL